MRLIVLIRSFNPRRTQFILQDIETRGKSFNPRAHTGRDIVSGYAHLNIAVSIHAPTRGATQLNYKLATNSLFQSTRPHGARPLLNACGTISYEFQSTRPHGARLILTPHNGGFTWFQSTRPHGARRSSPAFSLASPQFQSTRPHGARQYIQQTPEYLYSKLHFLRDMANIHAKLFLLSPTITNYLKLKHCESIAI